jgi:hypothetical protein
MSIHDCDDCKAFWDALGTLMNMAQEAEPPGEWPVDMERLVDAIKAAYHEDGTPPRPPARDRIAELHAAGVDLSGKPGGAMPREWYQDGGGA